MRCYILPQASGIDDLTLIERQTPRPGPGQVLVRMRAASLNYRDLLIVGGRYGAGKPPADLVPLSDGAGEVAQVGEGVTRMAVGDRVAGIFFARWLDGEITSGDHAHALGGAVPGVLSEYRLFEQDALVHVPPHLSLEEAATLPCAGLTAWNALFTHRPVIPGDTVLVLGTGGVSIFALQFARAAGARVIATSSSDEKLERVRAMGAAEVINYRAVSDWGKQVMRLTDGRGVDHVVEVGGAGTLPSSIAATRSGGCVHLIGVLTGGQIDPMPLLYRSVTLRGVFVGSRAMFLSMNRAIVANALHPVIDRVFPFEEAPAAYRALQAAGHLGKIVISIG